MSSGCFGVKGDVGFLGDPDAMEQNGQLTRYGNDSLVLCLLATSGRQGEAPAAKRRVLPRRAKYMVGTFNQQHSQITIPSLGDAQLRISIPRLTASWSQAQIATYIATSLKALFVSQRQHIG
jgi:hypothetical protein